jgi:hypothetical protein
LTPSLTPAAALLYDFVGSANQGSWSSSYIDTQQLAFLSATPSPGPEAYFTNFSHGSYVGWDSNAPLVGIGTLNRVLLTYPYGDNKVSGRFELDCSQAVPDAALEVLAGYRDARPNNPMDLIFRFFANNDLVLERKLSWSTEPSLRTTRSPVQILAGRNIFRLEVEPAVKTVGDNYGLWALARLSMVPSGGAPPAACRTVLTPTP